MFNVTLINDKKRKADVYTNLSEADAKKIAERMNRLNELIAKNTGTIIKNFFVVTGIVK